MATTTTTPEPPAGIAALLDAVHELVNPILTAYVVQAPQGVDYPYAVVSLLPAGTPGAVFGGASLEFVALQIAQYYVWAGETAGALADHWAIKEAIDLQSLTDEGIILYRTHGPRLKIEWKRILHCSQDYEFQWFFDGV